MNNYIYLDMNIIINYIDYYKKQNYIDLVQKINYLIKNENIIFTYSPAHIEEIAVIKQKVLNDKLSKKYIQQHLKIISKISKNFEFLPSEKNGIILTDEMPNICFKRVLLDYENTTKVAEKQEKDKIKNWKSLKINLTKENLNNIEANHLFTHKNIFKNYKLFLKDSFKKDSIPYNLFSEGFILEYEQIKNDFQMIQILIELTFDFLDYIGYKNDTQPIKKERYRSRMHDITHAIYGTKASLFVTNDNNFRNKLNAVYSLLKVDTKIITEKDFIEIHD